VPKISLFGVPPRILPKGAEMPRNEDLWERKRHRAHEAEHQRQAGRDDQRKGIVHRPRGAAEPLGGLRKRMKWDVFSSR
jgi:hypothetical protein